ASERRVLFTLRWAELAGLRETLPFSPTLDEWRVYYRLLLLHPQSAPGVAADRTRLGYAAALSRKDPEYPAEFARGVLAFRSGDLASAAGAFRRQLATHPGGA